MAATSESRTVSMAIERSPQEVFEFVRDARNLSRWASGLGSSIQDVDGEWVARTPQGPMKFRFVERNGFGILDHYVRPPHGAEIYVPLRVIANGTGSELVFTLFRLPGMTQEEFERDAATVLQDLTSLKRLLER